MLLRFAKSELPADSIGAGNTASMLAVAPSRSCGPLVLGVLALVSCGSQFAPWRLATDSEDTAEGNWFQGFAVGLREFMEAQHKPFAPPVTAHDIELQAKSGVGELVSKNASQIVQGVSTMLTHAGSSALNGTFAALAAFDTETVAQGVVSGLMDSAGRVKSALVEGHKEFVPEVDAHDVETAIATRLGLGALKQQRVDEQR
jgi:hypothetical protein